MSRSALYSELGFSVNNNKFFEICLFCKYCAYVNENWHFDFFFRMDVLAAIVIFEKYAEGIFGGQMIEKAILPNSPTNFYQVISFC